jgi:hypothetical protein
VNKEQEINEKELISTCERCDHGMAYLTLEGFYLCDKCIYELEKESRF